MGKNTGRNGLKPLRDLISLTGKRALITGSAAGIGKAIAYRFAEAGANLELVDIDEKNLEAVKGELSRFNGEINIHRVDLSEKEEVDILWKKLNGKEPEIVSNCFFHEKCFTASSFS